MFGFLRRTAYMGDKKMKNTSRRIRRIRRERAAKAYRRKVFARLVVLFAVLAVMTAAGVSALTTAFARDTGATYETVTVAKGDTLWGIAARYNYSDRDIRAVVNDIMRINNMYSDDIRICDSLNIPIY